MIHVYNVHTEDYSSHEGNFYCGRSKGGNPLSNPYTFNGVKSNLAKLSFKTREEAIKAYEAYFDKMYGTDEELTNAFDEIYELYKEGKDIYLGCFCAPKECHCNVIAERLQRKLIKERLMERKKCKQR